MQRHPQAGDAGGRQSAVLDAVSQRGRIHRADLAGAANLGQQDAAEALRALLDAGKVREDGEHVALSPEANAEPETWIPSGVRVRTTCRLGERRRIVAVEGDDLTPEEAADAIRLVGRELDDRSRAAQDAARLSRLAAHVEQHGSGEESRDRWNADAGIPADWRYATRQSFYKAAQRALDSPAQRLRKLASARKREAEEAGASEWSMTLNEMLEAAEPRFSQMPSAATPT